MVALLACLALQLGQGAVGAMDDGEADHAVIYALKALVHVTFPERKTIHDAAILVNEQHQDIEKLAEEDITTGSLASTVP